MSNQTLMQETAAVVRAFVDGTVEVNALQAKLQSVTSLLERTDGSTEVAKVVSNVEGDLEFITFTVFGDEVRPAVLSALEPLLPLLPPPPRPGPVA